MKSEVWWSIGGLLAVLLKKLVLRYKSDFSTHTLYWILINRFSKQEEVLIKERELEEARGKLLALRKAKYGDRQSDDEYYGYGATPSNYTYQTEQTRITETRYTSGYTSQ